MFRLIRAFVKFIVRHEAPVITAPAEETSVDEAIYISTDAPSAAHDAAEVDVNKKIRLVVFSNPQAYIRAASLFNKKLWFKVDVSPTDAEGAVAKFTEAYPFAVTADADAADAVLIDVDDKILHIWEADAGIAGSKIISVEQGFAVDKTGIAIKADVVDANTQTDFRTSTKADIHWWFKPEVIDKGLMLFQVFSGVQRGGELQDVLEIDLEETSAYWANAKVTNGVLDLIYAQAEPQNDITLEVI